MKLHLECDTCMDALMPVNGQALADYDDLVVAHSLQNSAVVQSWVISVFHSIYEF